jgi:hypothetical protein
MQETVTATKDFLVFDSGSRVVEPLALWEDTWTQSIASGASTHSSGKRVAPAPISRSTARSSATKVTQTCRVTLWQPGMDWDAIGALDPEVKQGSRPTSSGTGSFRPRPCEKSLP